MTTGVYTEVVTVPGSLQFVGGAPESLQSGAPLAIAQWRGRIRFRADIRAEWRIVDAETGRMFQISGYGDPDGRRGELELVLTEIQ